MGKGVAHLSEVGIKVLLYADIQALLSVRCLSFCLLFLLCSMVIDTRNPASEKWEEGCLPLSLTPLSVPDAMRVKIICSVYKY